MNKKPLNILLIATVLLLAAFAVILLVVMQPGCRSDEAMPTPLPPSPTETAVPPTPTNTPTVAPADTAVPTIAPPATPTSEPTSTPSPSPTPTDSPETAVTPFPTIPPTYRLIERGDTYWQFAADWYGNPYCWPSLQTANGWDRFMLPVGAQMALPAGCLETSR